MTWVALALLGAALLTVGVVGFVYSQIRRSWW